ncbi:MAG: Phosphate-selective porin [Deltaproteobacteria bacterium]|nr:Phosphate-selective porin [Deltaproteobacteria bacterium]
MNTVPNADRFRSFVLFPLSLRTRGILPVATVLALFALCPGGPARAQESPPDPQDLKIRELEKTVGALEGRIDAMDRTKASPGGSWADRFTFGGYGEMHANFGEGSAPDQFDIHRLVAYVGYTFSDWIRFSSEVELEHAFVSSGSDGEISIEQAFLDFLLSDPLNIRFGRVLVPVGITNRKHEPPTFYGVERPSFDRVIIPTTWFADGIGVFGGLAPSLKYELYLVSGLDGSQFGAVNGIRDGRIKERPSLHEPAVTGRLDFFPFVRWAGPPGFLRLGASAYYGGVDNGNQGDNPGIDGEVRILSGDFEYTVSKLDFRGAVAHEQIQGAREIGNGTASEIFGWYLEAGVRLFPESWKKGKLAKSDAAVFARYEDFDTQHRMPDGVAKNPAGDRQEWTFGASFFLTPTLVAKGDVQFRDDASGNDLPTLINFGLGWQF